MLKEADFIAQLKTILTADLRHDTFFDDKTRMVITQDLLVEGNHFTLKTISPEALGWKAIAVNLSDLAATAATPLWISIGLSLPSTIKGDWVQSLYKGMQACCNTYNCQIIGGDTTQGESITLSICAIGHVPENQAIGRRDGAYAGDIVAIAGDHGLSSLGLLALQQNRPSQYPQAVIAHQKPIPFVIFAQQLARQASRPIITMMDTSDGLADALIQLAEINHLSIDIDSSKIPLHAELLSYASSDYSSALELALYGGEDYGLCCILPQSMAEAFSDLHIIGTVTPPKSQGPALANLYIGNTVEALDRHKTYQHFN